MKFLKELLAAIVFAVLYFAIDQYWLHMDRTIGRNLQAAGIATLCYFVLSPLVKKWLKRRRARASENDTSVSNISDQ
jgi:hypothetical protein